MSTEAPRAGSVSDGLPRSAFPRSRRRWYVAGFLLLLVAPIAWYFLAGWLEERELAALQAELDADDPGWRWPDLLASMPALADEDNSVVQIGKVAGLARTPAVFNPGPQWDNASLVANVRLTDAQAQAVETAFGSCDPRLRDEARKLKDLTRGRYKISVDDTPFELDVEPLQRSRTVIYILQTDAALRAHEGDFEGAAESCQAMLNIPAAARSYLTLIGLLVRIAEQAIAVHEIERLLAQGSVSEPNLKKLQEMLEGEAAEDGVVQAMRGERAMSQQMYENLKNGKTTISKLVGGGRKGGIIESETTARLLDMFPNVILKDYPDYLRIMNANIQAGKLEPNERLDEMQKIEQKVRNGGNRLAKLIMNGNVKSANASARSQAYVRSAAVAVAAERYRLKHGAWPASLDVLATDGLIAKVPSDPYDGKPLRLQRTPTGIIVYSIGSDRIDNGGKLFRNTGTFDGTDFGFELWEPKFRGLAPPADGK